MNLVLYFHSIEPSFYAGLNRACRNVDIQYLEMLGPFACALFWILSNAEAERDDRLKFGEQLRKDGPLAYFSGSFLLFRFIYMK